MVKNLIKILFLLILTNVGFAQIKQWISPQGDTLYVMDKQTRDDIFELFIDNEIKDSLIGSYERELTYAKERIAYWQRIDSLNKKIDTYRVKTEKKSFAKIEGVFFEGSVFKSFNNTLAMGGIVLGTEFFSSIKLSPGIGIILNLKKDATPEITFGVYLRAGIKLF